MLSRSNLQPIRPAGQPVRAQVAERKPHARENAPAILPVVELLTHRWLAGADKLYLSRKYEMPVGRIEDIARFGCNRIIAALRGENARLRAEQRAA